MKKLSKKQLIILSIVLSIILLPIIGYYWYQYKKKLDFDTAYKKELEKMNMKPWNEVWDYIAPEPEKFIVDGKVENPDTFDYDKLKDRDIVEYYEKWLTTYWNPIKPEERAGIEMQVNKIKTRKENIKKINERLVSTSYYRNYFNYFYENKTLWIIIKNWVFLIDDKYIKWKDIAKMIINTDDNNDKKIRNYLISLNDKLKKQFKRKDTTLNILNLDINDPQWKLIALIYAFVVWDIKYQNPHLADWSIWYSIISWQMIYSYAQEIKNTTLSKRKFNLKKYAETGKLYFPNPTEYNENDDLFLYKHNPTLFYFNKHGSYDLRFLEILDRFLWLTMWFDKVGEKINMYDLLELPWKKEEIKKFIDLAVKREYNIVSQMWEVEREKYFLDYNKNILDLERILKDKNNNLIYPKLIESLYISPALLLEEKIKIEEGKWTDGFFNWLFWNTHKILKSEQVIPTSFYKIKFPYSVIDKLEYEREEKRKKENYSPERYDLLMKERKYSIGSVDSYRKVFGDEVKEMVLDKNYVILHRYEFWDDGFEYNKKYINKQFFDMPEVYNLKFDQTFMLKEDLIVLLEEASELFNTKYKKDKSLLNENISSLFGFTEFSIFDIFNLEVAIYHNENFKKSEALREKEDKERFKFYLMEEKEKKLLEKISQKWYGKVEHYLDRLNREYEEYEEIKNLKEEKEYIEHRDEEAKKEWYKSWIDKIQTEKKKLNEH